MNELRAAQEIDHNLSAWVHVALLRVFCFLCLANEKFAQQCGVAKSATGKF